MEMPDVVLFARELDAALKAERQKRKNFYKVIDENKKMEFINGEVCFQSPVKIEHNNVTVRLVAVLQPYIFKKQLGSLGVEKILVSLSRNDYEPDLCFFNKDKAAHFKPRQMQFPAPDFVTEILSDSTRRNDRETKFQDYAAHGVSEYWIIDPEHEVVEQYVLIGGEYDLILKARSGYIESKAISGFRISIRSIFDDEENFLELEQLLLRLKK